MKKLLLFAVIILLLGSCSFYPANNFDQEQTVSYTQSSDEVTPVGLGTRATGDNSHLALGNPSNASTSESNYLLSKTQYCLSYNNLKHIPNWVSWHLYSGDLGSTPRQDNFRADTTLPSGWYQVVPADYTGSGFDKGHMCPSGDRTSSVTNNSATFLMTNMIPQAPNNNQVTWERLESYCRTLVNSGFELYTCS